MTRIGMAAVVSMLAGTSAAQVQFYKLGVENLNLLVADQDPVAPGIQPNTFFIGNNISAVAWDGANLYVGGFNNSGATIPWAQVVKVEGTITFDGARNFRPIITLTDGGGNDITLDPVHDVLASTRRDGTTFPSGRGFTGMDFMSGAGLLISFDAGSSFAPGQIMAYDVETQLNPILLGAGDQAPRGNSGPAWDPGPTGQGYDIDGDGNLDGAIAAAITFDPAVLVNGPIGLDPAELELIPGQTVYDQTVGGPNIAIDPVSGVRDPLGGTIWRDMDFSPDGTTIVASAHHDLVIARRDANNNVTSRFVSEDGSLPSNQTGVIGTNVQYLDNFNGTDYVIFNRRENSNLGQPFFNAVELWDPNTEQQVAIELLDADGGPITFPDIDADPDPDGDGISYYDFSWHEPSQTLAVADFTNRQVYFFSPVQPSTGSLCADQNLDGEVNGLDFGAWLSNFNALSPVGDVNQDGSVNGLDFGAWLNAFNLGSEGPLCDF